jgi:hypothetical protein
MMFLGHIMNSSTHTANATRLTLSQVDIMVSLFYDEAVIDGDAGKVYFYDNGRFVRSAWVM